MELGLRGRTALITAASKGMGKASALALAAEGARVAICARTEADIAGAADEIRTTGWWTFFGSPEVTLDNYRDVLFGSANDGRLASHFVNSFVITLPSTVFVLGIAALAAYALAWIDFRGRDWVFLGIFALQIVPLQMSLVPLLRFFSQGVSVGDVRLLPAWELTGAMAFTNVWVAHTIFGLPLGIFLMHNFISQLPKSLFEAARVDGAGHGTIFRRVALPLIAPALVSLGIFQFLWVWNDLLVALVFLGGKRRGAGERRGNEEQQGGAHRGPPGSLSGVAEMIRAAAARARTPAAAPGMPETK